MKKALSIVALLMAFLLVALSCAACGDDEKKEEATAAPTATEQNVNATEQNTAAPADPTDAPNKTQPSEDGAAVTGSLAGTYNLTGGTGLSEDLLAQVIPTAKLVINADNIGTLTMLGQSVACAFDPETKVAALESGAEATYTFDGTTILIDMGEEGTQTWEKDDAAEASADQDSALAGTYTLNQGGNAGTLTIKGDNTGVLTDGYTTYDMTFDPSSDAVTIVVYGTTLNGTYTLDGEKLSITANGETIELIKN